MLNRILLILLLFCSNAYADVYYIGQWNWNASCVGEGGCWEAPQKQFLTGAVDLRSLPQQSLAGSTAQGWAIFSYSQAVSDAKLFNLSDNLDKKLTNPVKNKIQNELGITLDADNIRDALYEILTLDADPTGQTRWKPIMPEKDLKMRIYLGSEGQIKEVALIPGVSPEWGNVLAVIQEDYRRLIHEEEYARVARWLDYNEEKYGVFYGYFIPDGEVIIASLPHQTTITESFNTANSATLGPDLSWTDLEGDWRVVSNQGQIFSSEVSGQQTSRADSDLSTDDHYAQIVIKNVDLNSGSTPGARGVITRKDSTSTKTYYHFDAVDQVSDAWRTFKRVAGTYTAIGTDTVQVIAVDDVIKGQSDGSTITRYRNGSSQNSTTDTAITGNLRCGLNGYRDNSAVTPAQVDNFEAADLATGRTRNYL